MGLAGAGVFVLYHYSAICVSVCLYMFVCVAAGSVQWLHSACCKERAYHEHALCLYLGLFTSLVQIPVIHCTCPGCPWRGRSASWSTRSIMMMQQWHCHYGTGMRISMHTGCGLRTKALHEKTRSAWIPITSKHRRYTGVTNTGTTNNLSRTSSMESEGIGDKSVYWKLHRMVP